jgi:CzcA family heavy metal efflux pump
MMARLISLCVRRRGVVAVLALLVLAAGFWDARDTPLDVFPEFVPAQVTIQTEAPGFTPEQVEKLVTRPLESALKGAQALASLRSESIPGLSVLTVDFAAGTDPQLAHQEIAERLSALAGTLPAGIGNPSLSPLTSSTMDLLKIGLVSDRVTPFELRERAVWVIKPALLAVPGVARVNVFGGDVREIHVLPQHEKLSAYGLTLTELATGVRAALAQRGAGFLDLAAQRVLIETPAPRPDTHEIAEAVVAVRQGVPIRVRDVATVEQASGLRTGDALVQGKRGVLLTLSSQYGANTLETTHAVEAVLADLINRLEADGISVYPALHRPANFIERALGNLSDALGIAAVLIMVVLFAFLRDPRFALISFVTIPISLLLATAVMTRMGHTLNTMTIGGFAVAIGVLVDDAIVDIENILRRVRQNAAASSPRPKPAVVRDASLEIRGPVVFATLAVLAVFVPVWLTSSVQGRFVGPLALAFMLAVLASLAVALTVTPALCALFVSAPDSRRDARWIRRLKRSQVRLVSLVARHLNVVVAGLGVVFLLALAWLPQLGGSFMPVFREGHFIVQLESASPNTSFQDMLAAGARISRELLDLPFIATVEQQVGREEKGEDTWGPSMSEFHIELRADADVDQVEAEKQIRRVVESHPGFNTEIVTFLGDRLSESLTGESAAIVVSVFGGDLDALDRTGVRIESALRQVPGIVDLNLSQQNGAPEMTVRPDPTALASWGLSRADLMDTLQTSFSGQVLGQTYAGLRMLDVVLILPEELRNRPETIGNLTLSSPFGPVRLGALASIAPAVSRSAILHDDAQRRTILTFNVRGRPVQDTVADARAAIDALGDLPAGVFVRFGGQAKAERAARVEMAVYSAMALAFIVLLLFVCFRRRAHPFLVLANLPFALIGSIAAAGLTGIGLSIGTLVGLVTVFGISARNAILLLAHYEHLVDEEGADWSMETALRGATERLVPILMTAAVTGLGLLPLATGLRHAGYEIEGPMAITVLGGLLTSTLLSLLVLPALAERFSFRHARATGETER